MAVSLVFLGIFLLEGVVGQMAPVSSCRDLDSAACALFQKQQPDLCANAVFNASTCKRFCGNCPIECFSCPSPVRDPSDCNTTTTCSTDQQCMMKQYIAADGHQEYLMSCEDDEVCRGLGLGFGIGRRNIETRHISLDCCTTDYCNRPPPTTTTTTTTTTTRPPRTTINFTVPPTTYIGCLKDIVFVVDSSGSVGLTNFAQMKGFVHSIAGQLDIGPLKTQVALLTYSSTEQVQWYLNKYTNSGDVAQAVSRLPYHSGGTRTDLAMEAVRTDVLTQAKGDRPANRNVVVILTDGRSNKPTLTSQEAARLHTVSDDIISIGIGSGTSAKELGAIATDTHHVIDVHGFSALSSVIPKIMALICA